MNPELNQIVQGDSLEVLRSWPDSFVDCVITSPPYWGLRDYGVEGQLGLEPDYKDYINKLCDIFSEVKRVLKRSGSLWVNLADTYCAGNINGFVDATDNERIYKSVGRKKRGGDEQIPRKSLMQIPARFVIEMLNRGWTNRNEIIWFKPSCMPQSAQDRFTIDFEKMFFFVKSEHYYFEQQKEKAIWDLDGNGTIKRTERQHEGLKSNPTEMKNGIRKTYPSGKHRDGQQSAKTVSGFRNKRCVWKINTKPYHEAHFAVFPELLVSTPIKAACPIGGLVLDPFMGSGTTALVAKKLNRNYLGIELNPAYITIAEKRINAVNLLL